MNHYPHLFSPLTVKGKTFKNRILVSPMGLGEPAPPGTMSDYGVRFYERVAAGGCARVCTGENDVVYGSAVFSKYNLFLDPPDPAVIQSLRRYADACHRHGALAFTSFDHMGVYARTRGNLPPMPPMDGEEGGGPPPLPPVLRPDGTPYEHPERAYGPSELTIHEPYDGVTSRRLETDSDHGKQVYEMTREQMEEIARAFAHCAKSAKACGLDGMVIHAGHGFLFSQWVSRRFNRRTDEFGGSMENRARFPIMCLQRIREAVGDDFIVEMRFSAEEDISVIDPTQYLDGVVTLEEAVAFFKELDRYPGLLDIAHITGGLHTVPIYNIRTTANSYFPMGLNVRAAAAVKGAVKNIKVGVVGSLSDPELCERVIAEGSADFVILCRQLLIADPEFPAKAESGHPETINNCLRCVICRGNDHCAVNPGDMVMGEEDPLFLRPSAHRKKVVVVGGGIAGMKAAEYAARAGHSVVLFEKSDRLGGILNYTDNEPFKSDIRRFKDGMIRRLADMPEVDIRLNTEATPETVAAMDADGVLVAVGGAPLPLDLPGGHLPLVMDGVESCLDPGRVGERVAVIGGGLTGCEAAIHWANEGKQVTLISRSPELMRKVRPRRPADGSPDTHLVWLNKLPVDILRGCSCREVTPRGVRVEKDGEELFVEADTVINASGMAADPRGAAAFEGCAPFVRAIGDCVEPALIGDGVLAAKRAVVELG